MIGVFFPDSPSCSKLVTYDVNDLVPQPRYALGQVDHPVQDVILQLFEIWAAAATTPLTIERTLAVPR